MLDAAFLTAARDLLLGIAPELPQSLRVIEHPADMPRPMDAAGYVDDGRSRVFGHAGPTIVLLHPNYPLAAQWQIVLHEAAHLLPYIAPPRIEIELAAAQQEFLRFATEPHDDDADAPRWHPSHGRDFTRVALHLWWRAAMRGVVVPFGMLCAGMLYDLSPAFQYWTALGNEGVQMASATFAEILATPEPAEFRSVWQADLQFWMERHPDSVLRRMAA